MYNLIEHFKSDWANESAATLKILRSLTDESLLQKVYAEGRNLGFIAWHIANTVPEMMSQTGLSFEAFDKDAPALTTVAEIVEYYAKYSAELLERTSIWNDASLLDEISLYGETWQLGRILTMLITHEIHHRGQMTVLMRQAGLKVPGIYGPSKEEWESYGMPPMD